MSVAIARKHRLRTRITCPHCWQTTPPESVLWISSHPTLLGDPRLGPSAQQRFLPERFTATGEALDSRGQRCQKLACPHCHLTIPWAAVELEPIFISILGAPSSGKSVFLGAMTSALRNSLYRDFHVSFSDADPELNAQVLEYENQLQSMESPNLEAPTAFNAKIQKTQVDAFVNLVRMDLGGEEVALPSPFVFTLQPGAGHFLEHKSLPPGRMLCLYDNGGEAFEPGRDSVKSQMTRHLGQAQALLIVIDPTQDQRFQKAMKSADCDLRHCMTTKRQETYIQEAFRRIQEFAGMRQGDKFRPPVIVIVNKYDCWHRLLPNVSKMDPLRRTSDGFAGLLVEAISQVSNECKQLLETHCPDIVNAISSRAADVTFVPVSAAGMNTVIDDSTGSPALPPGAEPDRFWVTIPFLMGLHRVAPKLIPSLKAKQPASRS